MADAQLRAVDLRHADHEHFGTNRRPLLERGSLAADEVDGDGVAHKAQRLTGDINPGSTLLVIKHGPVGDDPLARSVGPHLCIYLPHTQETGIVLAKCKNYDTEKGRKTIANMVRIADLTRNAFMQGDVSTVMSPRTVITWAQNADIFGDLGFAFRLTFLNRCDELERPIVAEFYQRCFGEELPESPVHVAIA